MRALLSILLLIAVVGCGVIRHARAEQRQVNVIDISTPASGSNVLYEDWKDQKRDRVVPVKIYLPPADGKAHPVVVFSHGLGGSREAAGYLGKYWSEHGYLSVHIQHVGSDDSVWRPIATQGKSAVMQKLKGAIGLSTFLDRQQDVHFVLDELPSRNVSDPKLRGKLDLSKIAIAGHSYGANTALTMAGQKYNMEQRFGDPRVKAAIYLSPPANLNGRSAQEVFGGIKIPGLLMTGTEDDSPVGGTEDRRIPFDGIQSSDQYLVTFVGGDHMLFSGQRRGEAHADDALFHSHIEVITLAFLDAYLNGIETQRNWLHTETPKLLGSKAKFEQK